MSHVGKHMRVKVIYLTHTMGSLRPCDTGAQGNDGLQLGPMRNNIQSYLERRNLFLIDVFLQLGHLVDPTRQVPR
jgi:hypothetical protein